MRDHERAALVAAKRLVATRDDITGVDFGVRHRQSRALKALGIRFHVRRKHPLATLSAAALLPARIGRVACDVVEAGYEPHGSATRAMDPIRPGASIGNVEHQSTGTLGAFVTDLHTGDRCILSNWHVLCASTAAAVGAPISQPGPRHLGDQPARWVATVRRWAELSHGIDAAIAAVDPGIGANLTPIDLPAFAGVATPVVGMRVQKYGAVSGHTHAIVDGVGGSYPMDYSFYGDVRRWMDGIRLVVDPNDPSDEISLQGDSGAVWIETATGAVVALHFAGEDGLSPLAEYSLAHPFADIAARLEIAL